MVEVALLPAPTEDPNLTPRDRHFNRIISVLEFASSYSQSAMQLAWRGDEAGLERELKGLRVCVLEAIKTWKEMGNVG